MLRIVDARHEGGHRLWLQFSDGWSGVIDLAGRLNGPVFEPLTHVAAFKDFRLTDHTIEWACGADFAPEYLRNLASASSPLDEASSATTSP